MTIQYEIGHNRILDTLSDAALQRLSPHLTKVSLSSGTIVHDVGDLPSYVYFPVDCCLSLLQLTEDGGSSEIAMIGSEGMIGLSLLMGGGKMATRALTLNGGTALRCSRLIAQREFVTHDSFRTAVIRYTNAFITQTSQTAVCYRHHTIDQHLCRWLLLGMDRLPSSEIVITQEVIAGMLGVRREGVTAAAGKLQKANIIHCRRGRIQILNRKALEERVCECYQVIRTEFDRLLPPKRPYMAKHGLHDATLRLGI